jgi:hypothetical protein
MIATYDRSNRSRQLRTVRQASFIDPVVLLGYGVPAAPEFLRAGECLITGPHALERVARRSGTVAMSWSCLA